MSLNVFISHSHSDAEIAKAVRDLIDRTFETEVMVHVSSGSVGEGGIAAGGHWLEWITERVRTSPVALVLFTPDSLGRPWLMWEAGAVRGVAEAMKAEAARAGGVPTGAAHGGTMQAGAAQGGATPGGAGRVPQIVPVFFRMGPAGVPGPLHHLNAVAGDETAGVERLLDTIEGLVEHRHQGQRDRRRTVVPDYLETVDRALSSRPQPLTEDLVVEWCERIDDFRRTGRYADLDHLHRALLLAVAAGPKPAEAVLDVRLHRRLGELYLDRGRGREAADQFRLALQVVPRDIFLLHRLGMAQCEYGGYEEADGTLARILELDAEAALVNPEIAGLKGRIHRDRWQHRRRPEDLEAARAAYREAFERNPESHYLAVNVGELNLTLGDREAGLAAFDRGAATVRSQGDRDLWSLTTLLLADVAHGRWAKAVARLDRIDAVSPAPRELRAVRDALRRLLATVGEPAPELVAWLDRRHEA